MSNIFFGLLAEINGTSPPVSTRIKRASPEPSSEPKPMSADIPARIILEYPKEVQKARAQPMPFREGITIGEHLDEFDTWKDCNGNSFDDLCYLNLFNKCPPKGWTSQISPINTILSPLPAPGGNVLPKAPMGAVRKEFTNAVLNRIIKSSNGDAASRATKSKKRTRTDDDDDEVPKKKAKSKLTARISSDKTAVVNKGKKPPNPQTNKRLAKVLGLKKSKLAEEDTKRG